MKKHLLVAAGLLGLASLLATSSARANVTSNLGDLILSFRDVTNTNINNLEIDLGAYTRFSTLSAGTTVSLNYGSSFYSSNSGGLSPADLSTVYSSSWASNANLFWSVAGATDSPGATGNTFFVTLTTGVIPTRGSKAVQSAAASPVRGVSGALGGRPSTFNSAALVSPQAAVLLSSDPGSYADAITGSNPSDFVTNDYGYGQFDRSEGTSTETAVSSSGIVNFNLWQLVPGSGNGTNLGYFTLGSNGSFTFTAAPEPTSAMLLGLSGMTLLFRRRRTKA